MHMIHTKVIRILLCCLCCVLPGQQKAEAQWVGLRELDSYASHAQQLSALSQSLSILEKANPREDLRKALQKGDIRFVGYNGVGFSAPGVPSRQLIYALNHGVGVKALKGSTDFLDADLSNRLYKVTQTYMEPYNKALLYYLADRNRAGKKRTSRSKRHKKRKRK